MNAARQSFPKELPARSEKPVARGAGHRNHKNNNHIIVFNNEKYHFRHNFWLLFEQPQPHPLKISGITASSKGRPHFGWSAVRISEFKG